MGWKSGRQHGEQCIGFDNVERGHIIDRGLLNIVVFISSLLPHIPIDRFRVHGDIVGARPLSGLTAGPRTRVVA